MWTLIIPTCSLFVGTTALSTYIWYKQPHIVITLYMKYALYKIGLRVKQVDVGNYTYSYAERGVPSDVNPSILMVHGFSANKETWIPVIDKFPKDTHVVALDLLGHGDTSIPDDSDNNPESFVKDIYRFTDAIGLTENKIHLIGQSLGGSLVARYASLYPEQVCLVTLVCPAMNTPTKTDFMQEVEANTTGSNLLLPVTIEALELMLSQTRHSEFKLHKQILVGILQFREARLDTQEKLFANMQKEMTNPELMDEYMNDMKNIKAKTQIIWGEHDKVVHISGIDLLKEYLPQVDHLQIYERCGHSVNVDRPGLFGKSVFEFRSKYINDLSLTTSKKDE